MHCNKRVICVVIFLSAILLFFLSVVTLNFTKCPACYPFCNTSGYPDSACILNVILWSVVITTFISVVMMIFILDRLWRRSTDI